MKAVIYARERTMTRQTIWVLLLILFICPFLNSCKPQKPSYQTIAYVESAPFFVTSGTGGHLKKLFVNEGQSLSKGELILTLEGQAPIKAPASATVHEVFYQLNEFVPPNHPVVSLLLPSQMRIIFYIPERHLDRIKLGEPVSVFIQKQKYSVKITYIANQAEYTPDALFSEKNNDKSVYKVKADVSAPGLRQLLKIGQTMEVNYE